MNEKCGLKSASVDILTVKRRTLRNALMPPRQICDKASAELCRQSMDILTNESTFPTLAVSSKKPPAFRKQLGTVLLATLVGCMPAEPNLLSALADIPVNGSLGVPVSDALTLPPEAYVCILEPYRDDVSARFRFSAGINAHLARQRFSAEEGRWTVVYGADGAWQSEQISRRSFQLVALPTNSATAGDVHVCGYAKTLYLVKLASKQIAFVNKGEM